MLRKKRLLVGSLLVLLIGLAGAMFILSRGHTPRDSLERQTVTEENGVSRPFNKQMYPIDAPGSIWWVVSRDRPLSEGYVPDELIVPDVRLRLDSHNEQMHLEPAAARALEAMFAAAKADGIELVLSSGYRSAALQRQFYNDYVARDGQAAADRYSARPGTSEHQTGMAADVIASSDQCHLETCFADMPEGRWVAANAYKYGFIIRYPDGKEHITGYHYEPWHLRYVGVELAEELYRQNLTMEELFGLAD